MVHIVQFPESHIALAKEVHEHPELMKLLGNHPVNDFETKLAEIALYCDYVVHGDFYSEEINKLCDILIQKLREKRRAIILTTEVTDTKMRDK